MESGAFASKPTVEGYRHGRVPREIRTQQLLDVAEQVFIEFGYHGASIEEVTRRANVKRPLIYGYFGGKEGLYLACYRRARADLEGRLAAALTESDPLLCALGAGARAYFGMLAEQPQRWGLLYGGGAPGAGALADQIREMRFATPQMLAALTRDLSPGTDDATVEAFAHAASGAAEQLAHWWRQRPDVTLDQIVERYTRFSWAGLSQLVDPPADGGELGARPR
jgi:AcrR family transcriptional regulator